MDLAKQT